MTTEPAEPVTVSPSRKTMIMRLVRYGLALAAVIFVGLAVADRWQQVRDQIGQINIWALLVSTLAMFAVIGCGMMVWRAVLADLGSPLAIRPAARVMLLGQLGKYVPGSLWSVMAQMELASDLGVPRRRSGTASLVFNVLGLGVGLLLALLALPTLLASSEVPAWVTWVIAASPLGLICLAPPILTRLTNKALGVMRREPLEHPFSWRGSLTAFAWTVAMWVFTGLHIWVLGVALGADPAAFVVPALGGYAAAWAAGFIFVLAPAGIGVREVLLTVTLAPALPGGAAAALTVAVISRAISVVCDVVAAVSAHAMGRQPRGGLTAQTAPEGGSVRARAHDEVGQ